MKIIISPTKQMVNHQDFFFAESQPEYLKETSHILRELKKLSFIEAKALWKCNDKLAQENYERIQQGDLSKATSPAIMSYKGLQYQYMAPDVLTKEGLTYLQENLRILSGFYGILRPFDAIIPYRLEMQAPLAIGKSKNLYAFWGKKLAKSLQQTEGPIINLASKEYSKSIEPYLTKKNPLITIQFAQRIDGKLKVKATLAKMARGEMVRYLAENNVTELEEIKHFDHPHYQFSPSDSTDSTLVFLHHD